MATHVQARDHPNLIVFNPIIQSVWKSVQENPSNITVHHREGLRSISHERDRCGYSLFKRRPEARSSIFVPKSCVGNVGRGFGTK